MELQGRVAAAASCSRFLSTTSRRPQVSLHSSSFPELLAMGGIFNSYIF